MRHLVNLPIALIGFGLLSPALCQSPNRLAFEVTSVKPSPDAPGASWSYGVTPAGNRFNGRNITLRNLILAAYNLADWQLSGGPPWLDTDRFYMDAQPEHPSTRENMMAMLQSLLADRFQVVLRRESKEMPRYVLTVDKREPKLLLPSNHSS